MGAAFFYHLTREPMEATLPVLLGKAQQAGWRILLRGRDESRLRWLDERLWQGAEDSFLAHGMAGGPHDALQPILLADETLSSEGAACLMTIEGATVSPEEVHRLERTCILFDGNDPDAVQTARDQWKALTAAGCAAQYWSQEEGPWRKKAESNGT